MSSSSQKLVESAQNVLDAVNNTSHSNLSSTLTPLFTEIINFFPNSHVALSAPNLGFQQGRFIGPVDEHIDAIRQACASDMQSSEAGEVYVHGSFREDVFGTHSPHATNNVRAATPLHDSSAQRPPSLSAEAQRQTLKQEKKERKPQERRSQLMSLLQKVPAPLAGEVSLQTLDDAAKSEDKHILIKSLRESGIITSLRVHWMIGKVYAKLEVVAKKSEMKGNGWKVYLKSKEIVYTSMRQKFRWFELCEKYTRLEQLDCNWSDVRSFLTSLEKLQEENNPVLRQWM